MGIACRKAPVTAWDNGVAYGQTSVVSNEHLLRFKTFAFEMGLVDTRYGTDVSRSQAG
jgi:hypothetical protein